MIKYGKMFTCDRCGKEKFKEKPDPLKTVDPPAGWSNQFDRDLCPECTDLCNKMLNALFAPEVKRCLNFDSERSYEERK